MIRPAATSSGPVWRTTAARGLLVAGVVLGVSQVAPLWPRSQSLALDLGQSGGLVKRVDLAWMSDQDGELLGGVELAFPDGAPSVVRHALSLPNGRYVLDVAMVLAVPPTGAERTRRFERTVRLDGTQTRLYFEDLVP
jgi:hypothetical protein